MDENQSGATPGGPRLPPADQRCFEDYQPGATYTNGSVEVTEAEIVQ
jgi:hypothetical protein